MSFSRGWTVLTLLFLGAVTQAAPPATTAPSAADLVREHLVKTYQDVQTFQTSVIFTISQKQGRLTQSQTGDYNLAYDRAAGKLMLDKPEFLLVSDGQKLRLKVEQIPGRHMEVPAPRKLDYQALVTTVPVLAEPATPELALLLADDPIKTLSGSDHAQLTLVPPPVAAQPTGLLFHDQQGNTWTLWVDPATNYLAKATLAMDAGKLGGNASDALTATYEFGASKTNQPLPAKTFAFDTTKSQSVNSLQALVQAAGSGGGADGNQLEGQDAPAVELQALDGTTFKLADAKAAVVILDFWATWCGPCRKSLPGLQSVQDWAQKKNKSVAIYAVNLQETPEQITAFLKEAKLTLPVLLDPDGKAAKAYNVSAIPQTVVIVKGKVVKVQVGLSPNGEDDLKNLLEKQLAPTTAPAPN